MIEYHGLQGRNLCLYVCVCVCVVGGVRLILCYRPLYMMYCGGTLTMRPINTHSSPAVISDSTEKQNLNQTMSCTADGEQKSKAVKSERE